MIALDLPDRGEDGPVDAVASRGALVGDQVVDRYVRYGNRRRLKRSFTKPAASERADDHDEEERQPRAPDENRPGECAAASKGHRGGRRRHQPEVPSSLRTGTRL